MVSRSNPGIQITLNMVSSQGPEHPVSALTDMLSIFLHKAPFRKHVSSKLLIVSRYRPLPR